MTFFVVMVTEFELYSRFLTVNYEFEYAQKWHSVGYNAIGNSHGRIIRYAHRKSQVGEASSCKVQLKPISNVYYRELVIALHVCGKAQDILIYIKLTRRPIVKPTIS